MTSGGVLMESRVEADQGDLVERIRQGDKAAIEQAYDAYFTPVMNFAYYTVYNYETAKDVSQEAFLKVVSAIKDKKKDVRDFKAYLFQTARNLALDEVRKSSRHAEYPLESIIAEDPSIFADPERAALLTEQRTQVAAATSRLNDSQKVALTLKDIEGWSYKDIGGLLELSTNAVGVLLSRARLKFRREFRLQQIDPDSLSQECKNIFPLMSAVIDGEATEEQRRVLSEHLDACPLCREAMSEMAGASSTLRSLIPLAPVVAAKAALVAKAAVVAGAGTVAVVGTGMGFLTKMMIGAVISLVAVGAGVGAFIAIKSLPVPPDPYVRVAIPTEGETLTRSAAGEGKTMVKIFLEVDNEPSAVELDIDGQVVHRFDKGPYRYSWEAGEEGSHIIKPIALDADGNRYPGTQVTFTLALTASKIVFERDKRIWIMNPDGTEQKQITWTGEDSNPALSPDGKYVVFQRRKEPVNDDNTSTFVHTDPNALFLISADGNDPKRLTPPEWATTSGWTPLFPVQEGTKWLRRDCLEPSFSSDGSAICFKIRDEAYQETPDGGRGLPGLDGIAVMDLQGTESTGTDVVLVSDSMYSGPFYSMPHFSPGGEYIYFGCAGGGGPPGIGLDRIDADGENRAVVIPCEIGMHTGGVDRGYYAFDISPDGTKIACVEMTWGENRSEERSYTWNARLCLFNIDGTDKRYIGTGDVSVGAYCLCFSPDGAEIAFTNEEYASMDGSVEPGLYVVGIDGAGLKKVAENAVAPSWK